MSSRLYVYPLDDLGVEDKNRTAKYNSKGNVKDKVIKWHYSKDWTEIPVRPPGKSSEAMTLNATAMATLLRGALL
ncbi:hypothetical protein PsorP6_015196 [Peronosclerospora sorghi]|uniref:Uncharacterized protein n=1 Tax=Peronosclerospora sorghi TaxID=230839 RepID=A0ACC0VT11_9STRA|nr:hypothetical protein PsorP6_015196 [Peronosclerospora sorghi]